MARCFFEAENGNFQRENICGTISHGGVLIEVKDIVLFGGTTEGKLLVEYMEQQEIASYVCVATEYGKEVLPAAMKCCEVLVGRMNREQMVDFFRWKKIRLVLDATHPYAVEVTQNITWACGKMGIHYIRIGRETTPEESGAVYVASAQEAADYLGRQEGNALLTTGSKELKYFRSVTNYKQRFFARILPVEQAIRMAEGYGFRGEHLICGKGPFCVEQNVRMIEECHAKYLVTKDTGVQGGFPEKAEAARQVGICLLVIQRPAKEAGITLKEVKAFLKEQDGEQEGGHCETSDDCRDI